MSISILYTHMCVKRNMSAKEGIHVIINKRQEIKLSNACYICILLLSPKPSGFFVIIKVSGE